MKKFVILASVLMLTFAFISTVPAADIKVGTLMAQTGPLKEYGPPIKDGAVLAGKQMAAAGFTIEWFHEDSETNPAPATNAAKKLVNASTNPLMTVLPADEGIDFLFRTCPSDALQGVVAGKLAASYNKTVSILYVNNAYGTKRFRFYT
jgi:ABC-type branched-subunit amino acid transport system substrate-binding protein